VDVGQHYERSRRRLTALLHGSGADVWEAPVPACPGWRVRDVVAHLVGNVEDAIAGRLTGPPSEAQTAAQVERHLGDEPEVLLATWTEWAPLFEAAITERGALPAAIDALTHEHDIRHAIDRPGGRDDVLIPDLARTLLGRLDDAVHLTAFLDGVPHDGVGRGPALGLRTSAFEVFRAAMGRRSRDQVRSLDWTGDPESVLDRFFVFGPADAPLVE
jgi:uncharacterized protein (TIGR03083 family)